MSSVFRFPLFLREKPAFERKCPPLTQGPNWNVLWKLLREWDEISACDPFTWARLRPCFWDCNFCLNTRIKAESLYLVLAGRFAQDAP